LDISEKLKRMRELRNYTTSQLAEISGVPQSTISKIENGKSTSPTIDTIKKLAKALNITPMYFLDDSLVTPFDFYDDWPEDVKKAFLDNEEGMAYLKVTEKAKQNGISPKALENIVNSVIETTRQVVLKRAMILFCPFFVRFITELLTQEQ
jgi:transcriptional regulator with XRE-family HTH domain